MSEQKIIHARYRKVLDDFALDADVEFPMAGVSGIYGPSGAGKTTLLRCIAGLDASDDASLIVNGDQWEDVGSGRREVHERRIGYVFQDGRLFPHLSVRQNLLYGRDRSAAPPDDDVFATTVQTLELDPLLDRRPTSLSGGESQRVAIARAVLRQPVMLLMDEPLASVDVRRRYSLLPYLEQVSQALAVPILFVSHNIDEICQIADHLVVMDGGRVVAAGEPQQVLVRAELPVLSDEEAGTVIRARIDSIDSGYGLTQAAFSGGRLWLTGTPGSPGDTLRVRIRANDVSLCLQRPENSTILNTLPAVVEGIVDNGAASQLVRLTAGDDTLLSRITRRSAETLGLRPGMAVIAQIKSVAVRQASL